jgi:hypothetical protein
MSVSSGPITCLKSQEEVSKLLQSVYEQISVKTEAVKVYAEALSALRTGKADKAFIGDYHDSNRMIFCLADTVNDDEDQKEVIFGRTIIRYSLTNKRLLTGFQVFNEALKKATTELLANREEGAILTEEQIESVRVKLRGDATRRSDIRSQNSIVIQIIVGKLDVSYVENLRSVSKQFKFGSDNQCLLSLIEGIRNFVANPNAEISPDAAIENRERAESELKKLELSTPVQLNHYRMKTLVMSYVENVRRTSSVWSEGEIMRLIIKKLEQENLFQNIEKNWSTDIRYSSCSTLELFWKILEAEFNVYASTEKGKAFLSAWREEEQQPHVVNITVTKNSSAGGGSSSLSSASLLGAVKEFDDMPKCHNHIRFVMGHQKEPCSRGNACRFAHVSIVPKTGSTESVMSKAKRAFDKVSNTYSNNRPTRDQAKKLYKHFKSADQVTNSAKSVQPVTKSVYLLQEEDAYEEGESMSTNQPKNFDESEFDAFFTELLRSDEVSGDEF